MKKIFSLLFFLNLISLIFNPLVNADQTVTASVPPRTADYQFDFVPSDGQTTVRQGSTLTYQITYGAKQTAAFPTANTSIVVDWSNDKAPNNADLLEYVNGSATTAYGGSVPVVDLINRTITWTIPNLPAGTTDQAVTFQVKALDNYPASVDNPIPFILTSSMHNQYVTMPDQTIMEYYRYHTPAPGPTATPGPRPTAAITPTPTPPSPAPGYAVAFPGISDNTATVAISSSYPSKLSVSYGTTPANLSRTISSSEYKYQNSITLSDLAANTAYYFRFTLTYPSGRSVTSEIYTFRTAKKSSTPTVDNNIIVFTANGTIYFTDTQKQAATSNPSVILTDNTDYQIAYAFTKPVQLKSIEAVVLNKILGSNTLAAIQLPTDLVIPMQEKVQNLYIANSKTVNAGLYEVYVRITDANGNIVEKKITDLKVLPRLTVYAQDTNRPLQDARVFLSYFDPKTNAFHQITQDLLGNFANPSYTNVSGQLAITLPAGRYRVEASALLYNKVITDFIIGPGINQNYPITYLKRDPLNFISLFTFTKDYLSDTWIKTITTLNMFSSSIRIFHLFAVAILGSFVIINFLLFTLRSHIKIYNLPVFFLFHIDRICNRHKQKYLFGTITDEENKAMSQVLIEIEDKDTKSIVMETYTNKAGKFYCRNTFTGEINVIITREGYEVTTLPLNALALPDTGLQVSIKRGTHHYHSTIAHLKVGISESIGVLFETSLVITLILEFLFFTIYGFAKTSPYLTLSIINILLWLFYVHEHSQKSSL